MLTAYQCTSQAVRNFKPFKARLDIKKFLQMTIHKLDNPDCIFQIILIFECILMACVGKDVIHN